MNKQEIRDLLFPNNIGNQATKEDCTAHIGHLLQCGDECKNDLNRLAAEVVMEFYLSKQYRNEYLSDCWRSKDREFQYYTDDWNPCGDSNHAKLLFSEIDSNTQWGITAKYFSDHAQFILESKEGDPYYERKSKDNSAAIALCIIAVFEAVFAKAESEHEV